MTLPRYSKLMDFEFEFGFYVRRKGVDIHGYTIFNDFSACDAQTQETGEQLGQGVLRNRVLARQ